MTTCIHPQVSHRPEGGCKEPGCQCTRTNGFEERSCGAWLHTVHDPKTMEADLRVLAQVGRMYLDALAEDPENELLTLVEAIHVTEVREAVKRWETTPSTDDLCYCNGDPAHPWHEHPIPD